MSMPSSNLSQQGILQVLPAEQLWSLASHGRSVRFRTGQTIFRQGNSAEAVYFLTAGQVDLRFTPDDRFRTSVTIAVIRPGEAFGWSTAMGQPSHSCTAVCTADAQAVEVAAEEWRSLLAEDEALGEILQAGLEQVMARRLEAASTALWLSGLP